jgi:hypothetical protein
MTKKKSSGNTTKHASAQGATSKPKRAYKRRVITEGGPYKTANKILSEDKLMKNISMILIFR